MLCEDVGHRHLVQQVVLLRALFCAHESTTSKTRFSRLASVLPRPDSAFPGPPSREPDSAFTGPPQARADSAVTGPPHARLCNPLAAGCHVREPRCSPRYREHRLWPPYTVQLSRVRQKSSASTALDADLKRSVFQVADRPCHLPFHGWFRRRQLPIEAPIRARSPGRSDPDS